MPAVNDPLSGAVTRPPTVAREGDADAMASACELLYSELREMAHARLRCQQPLTLLDTTALVHESYLWLEKLGTVAMPDRSHFLGYAALGVTERTVGRDWRKARMLLYAALTPGRGALLERMMEAEMRGDCALPPLPLYSAAELATDAPADLRAGAEVGPYRLLRGLGCGGMASVWLAERSDGALKRQVALKLPHSSLPQRRLAERFDSERYWVTERHAYGVCVSDPDAFRRILRGSWP